MPIEDLRSLVAALATNPVSLADRRKRAAALARHMAATVETCAEDDPQVLAAVQAIEHAYRILRPEHAKGPQFHQDVLDQLVWGKQQLELGLNLEYMSKVLAEAVPQIPAARWRVALESWRGETPVPRGKPAPGTYFWHRVLYTLIHGKDADGVDATHFRDALLKWRRDRQSR